MSQVLCVAVTRMCRWCVSCHPIGLHLRMSGHCIARREDALHQRTSRTVGALLLAIMPNQSCRLLFCVLLCVLGSAADATSFTHSEIRGVHKRIEGLASWFARPRGPTDVKHLLPESRPVQQWPFRDLHSAVDYSVVKTDTHAVLATVSHAPIPGVTSDMVLWWFQEGIYGKSSSPGDENIVLWDNYIRWHPQQHIYQRVLRQPSSSAAAESAQEASTQHQLDRHEKPMLWELCEFMTSSEPTGYTQSNYPGPEATAHEYFVKAEAEVRQLDHQGLWVTVPSKTGLGDTFWHLKHSWADTPEGLVVNSTQAVGVVDPTWRPLWFARLRNAIIRGLFSKGRDPTQLLSYWVKHCIEEIGNLQHILPLLYQTRPAAVLSLSTAGRQGQESSGMIQSQDRVADEL